MKKLTVTTTKTSPSRLAKKTLVTTFAQRSNMLRRHTAAKSIQPTRRIRGQFRRQSAQKPYAFLKQRRLLVSKRRKIIVLRRQAKHGASASRRGSYHALTSPEPLISTVYRHHNLSYFDRWRPRRTRNLLSLPAPVFRIPVVRRSLQNKKVLQVRFFRRKALHQAQLRRCVRVALRQRGSVYFLRTVAFRVKPLQLSSSLRLLSRSSISGHARLSKYLRIRIRHASRRLAPYCITSFPQSSFRSLHRRVKSFRDRTIKHDPAFRRLYNLRLGKWLRRRMLRRSGHHYPRKLRSLYRKCRRSRHLRRRLRSLIRTQRRPRRLPRRSTRKKGYRLSRRLRRRLRRRGRTAHRRLLHKLAVRRRYYTRPPLRRARQFTIHFQARRQVRSSKPLGLLQEDRFALTVRTRIARQLMRTRHSLPGLWPVRLRLRRRARRVIRSLRPRSKKKGEPKTSVPYRAQYLRSARRWALHSYAAGRNSSEQLLDNAVSTPLATSLVPLLTHARGTKTFLVRRRVGPFLRTNNLHVRRVLSQNVRPTTSAYRLTKIIASYSRVRPARGWSSRASRPARCLVPASTAQALRRTGFLQKALVGSYSAAPLATCSLSSQSRLGAVMLYRGRAQLRVRARTFRRIRRNLWWRRHRRRKHNVFLARNFPRKKHLRWFIRRPLKLVRFPTETPTQHRQRVRDRLADLRKQQPFWWMEQQRKRAERQKNHVPRLTRRQQRNRPMTPVAKKHYSYARLTARRQLIASRYTFRFVNNFKLAPFRVKATNTRTLVLSKARLAPLWIHRFKSFQLRRWRCLRRFRHPIKMRPRRRITSQKNITSRAFLLFYKRLVPLRTEQMQPAGLLPVFSSTSPNHVRGVRALPLLVDDDAPQKVVPPKKPKVLFLNLAPEGGALPSVKSR